MFGDLSSKLENVFAVLGRKKIITMEHFQASMSEVRKVLLDGDVALSVVSNITKRIEEKVVNEKVLKGVKPHEMIVKFTQDEITHSLGEEFKGLSIDKTGIIMMVGLQGSGKTTTSAKLAKKVQDTLEKKVFLVSLDLNRPAAQDQLMTLASQNELSCFEPQKEYSSIIEKFNDAKKEAGERVLILDTAGRMEVEEGLMSELKELHEHVNPDETIMVIDALLGRESVNIIESFNQTISLTGIVLTRIDADFRGGVALNAREVTGIQIKYITTGEKIADIEEFHPERIAGRILDMGDIVTLVEKAKSMMDESHVEKLEDKIKQGKFDMNDLLQQIKSMKKFGGIEKILGFLPGMGKIKDQLAKNKIDDSMILHQEAIILSMTVKERSSPKLVANSSSRKRRIANGCGMKLKDVNQILKRFDEMSKLLNKAKGSPNFGSESDFDLANISQNDISKLIK